MKKETRDGVLHREMTLDEMLTGIDQEWVKHKSAMAGDGGFGNQNWDLGIGYDKSWAARNEGMPGEAAKCQAMLDKVQAKLADITEPGVVRSTVGPIWDIPSVLNGDPEPAFDFAEVPAQVIAVRVVLNVFFSAGVNASRLATRARAIAALLAVLNELGYAVEMDLFMPSNGSKLSGSTVSSSSELVSVHEPGNIFDLSKIAYWSGHPAAIRNLFYGYMFQENKWNNSHLNDRLDQEMKEACKKAGDIYIESGHLNNDPHFQSDETAAAWVKQQVEDITSRHPHVSQ